MTVIRWRDLALLGGPQSHSGFLLLGPCLPLKTSLQEGIPSQSGMGLDVLECWQPLYLCLGWAEACAFWRHFFVSAFTISSLKGRAGRGAFARCGNRRDSSTPLTAFFSPQEISGTHKAQVVM